MAYSGEQLNELCSKINLVEYVSEDHELRCVGGRNYILCPFHYEKTPSMKVDEDRYYCFSCHRHGNIIDWMRNVENLSFNEAVEKAAKLSGTELVELKRCETLQYFRSVRNVLFPARDEEPMRQILPQDSISQFVDEYPQEWKDEGITPQTMKRYNIRLDKKSNRIVYPVYDVHFNMIGFKGRTRFTNYKELKVPKYANYQHLGRVDYFGGMKENYNFISQQKRAIIFEGIKSVMKLEDFGDPVGISAETCAINDSQIVTLLKLGLNEVTIAFDSDVAWEEVVKTGSKLKRFMNVYAIRDTKRLLGDKEAPVDQGKAVWEQLYRERIKI